MAETMTSEQFRSNRKYRELESGFQKWVSDLAESCGYLVFHWPDSRRATESGWPDLTMLGRDHLIFAELKREGAKRSTSQVEVGDRLQRIQSGNPPWEKRVRYFVWQPSDRPEIEEILKENRN